MLTLVTHLYCSYKYLFFINFPPHFARKQRRKISDEVLRHQMVGKRRYPREGTGPLVKNSTLKTNAACSPVHQPVQWWLIFHHFRSAQWHCPYICFHVKCCDTIWRYPRQQETLCRSVKPNFRLSCWKWHCQVEKVRKTKDKFCQLLFLPPLLIRFMVNVRVTLGQLIRARFPPPNNCLLIIWVFMGTGRCLSSATFLLLGSIWRELGDWPHQDD